jgi:hypothetical protein
MGHQEASTRPVSSDRGASAASSALTSIETPHDPSFTPQTLSSSDGISSIYYDPPIPAYGSSTPSSSFVSGDGGASSTSVFYESSKTSNILPTAAFSSSGGDPTAQDPSSSEPCATTFNPYDPPMPSVTSSSGISATDSPTFYSFSEPYDPTLGISSSERAPTPLERTSAAQINSQPSDPTKSISVGVMPTNYYRNNCFRQLYAASSLGEQFCATYIATTSTAATGLQTFVSRCDNNPSKVPSACSCVETGHPYSALTFSDGVTITDPVPEISSSSTTSYSDLETFPSIVDTTPHSSYETGHAAIPTSEAKSVVTEVSLTDSATSSTTESSDGVSVLSSSVSYPFANSTTIHRSTAPESVTTHTQRSRSTIYTTVTVPAPTSTTENPHSNPSSMYSSGTGESKSSASVDPTTSIGATSSTRVVAESSGVTISSSNSLPTPYPTIDFSTYPTFLPSETVSPDTGSSGTGLPSIVYLSASAPYPTYTSTLTDVPSSTGSDPSSSLSIGFTDTESTTSALYSPSPNFTVSAYPSGTVTYPGLSGRASEETVAHQSLSRHIHATPLLDTLQADHLTILYH